MPELPEVETTRRGLSPHVCGRRIEAVRVRDARLRQPIPPQLASLAVGQTVRDIRRRGKYLLFDCGTGHLLVHLGMSGSLRLVDSQTPVLKHEHVDIVLDSGHILRYRDPRRFGLFLWCEDPAAHPLLAALGPEPLAAEFDAAYLHAKARGRRQAVKPFLMDSHVVVGVGNIYAGESLFAAGIHPERAAGRISEARYAVLAACVREVLEAAIAQGGTTLRDFIGGEGRPGYFAQSLKVYGRAGAACVTCGTPVRHCVLGQRATYYCPHCQH